VADPERSDLTIDDLAARTGIKSSTIRMYQHQGVLPGPEIRGRVGYYGDGHLARLDLVKRLQERGYTLAAIKDLASSWESGRGLGSLLGFEQVVAGTETTRREVRLTFAEFAARFPDAEIEPATLQHAVDLGLIEVTADGIRVPDARFLDIGAEIARLGVPPADLLDEWEHVEAATRDLAARFRAAFEARVWAPFVEAGMPAADLAAVTEKLRRMQELGQEIVAIALAAAIEAEAANAVSAAAEHLTAESSAGTNS
jgi:DNA-binding transcriptional MerR regulator